MDLNVGSFWCVGRNYADHAKELGNEVPTAPLIFLKSGSCAVAPGSAVSWPAALGEIHYETELALQFDSQLNFSAITVALDLTARQKQNELKKKGEPWTLAKSFQNACLLGAFQPLEGLADLQKNGEVILKINGETRQHGHFHDMIFPLAKLREYVLEFFPVRAGDVLLTGTPAGVGPFRSGDQVEAWVTGVSPQKWLIK